MFILLIDLHWSRIGLLAIIFTQRFFFFLNFLFFDCFIPHVIINSKAHNKKYGSPLMLPIVIDYEFEASKLDQNLVEMLTAECSSVLNMKQV